MASNDTNCGGYDEVFVDPVGDFLKCIVCHLVLKVPLQVMKCGHRFCETCFNQMKTYSEQFKLPLCCPIDRDEIDMKLVFNDTGMARQIGDLEVECSLSLSGCTWSGELRELEAHKVVCGYTAKASQVQLNNIPSEISSVLENYHQRLVVCEEKVLEKEKDIAYLKFNLQEMKNKETEMELKKKSREDEMEMLRLQNLDLNREIKILKDQPYRFADDAKEKDVSLNIAQLKTDIDEIKTKLDRLGENNDDTLKRKKSKLSNAEGLGNKRIVRSGSSANVDVPANEEALETIFQEIDELRAQSNHINDLLPYSENTSLVKNTVFVWRINDFYEKFNARKMFFSSMFYCHKKGHICQLVGSFPTDKQGMLVAIRLSKGKKGAAVSTFNCEVGFELIYNDGRRMKLTMTAKDIDENRGSFSLKGNGTVTPGHGYANFCRRTDIHKYVRNGRCTIICTLIPKY